MTFQELNNMAYNISDKVRHFRTFAKLFQLAVLECPNLETQQERLPAIDDISTLALMLADQAENAVDMLLDNIPSSVKGISP